MWRNVTCSGTWGMGFSVGRASALAGPARAEQLLLLVVVQVERALPGVVQAVGDATRNVRGGGRDDRALGLVLDGDDPFHRVLGLLARLAVLHQVEHLFAVLL